ncbi:hypothetical protein PoB_005812500 [Plakobranchus ocellatus]|uniref:Uncharacterized protein n=1 Tax=Plakobranchus ocellatus TaxID=259542 RepID=A0AAV4CJ42_9GAST|nr:hypothetical protein PoB_005812500 [Plakobranchus ocellatus]
MARVTPEMRENLQGPTFLKEEVKAAIKNMENGKPQDQILNMIFIISGYTCPGQGDLRLLGFRQARVAVAIAELEPVSKSPCRLQDVFAIHLPPTLRPCGNRPQTSKEILPDCPIRTLDSGQPGSGRRSP